MESSVRINKLTILLTWRPPLFFPSGEINGLNNFNYLPQCPLVLDQTASLNKHSSHQGGKFTNFLTRFIPLPHPFGSPVKGCPCFLAFQSGLAQSSLSNFILSMEENVSLCIRGRCILMDCKTSLSISAGPKFHTELQETQNSQTILEMNKVGRLMLKDYSNQDGVILA